MISAAGIKDQGLTIIVSMMLIKLALSPWTAPRFSSASRCLTRKGSSYWSRCEFAGRATRGTISLGQEASSKAPNTPNLETRAWADHRSWRCGKSGTGDRASNLSGRGV